MQPKRALEIYLNDYRKSHKGINERLDIFRQVKTAFGCKRVLYPGSYLHVTPSLVFPLVCYIDSLKNICKGISNPELLVFLHTNKEYPENAEILCYEEDYDSFEAEPKRSFDFLISLNAGFISQACKHFLAPGGLLLVNDEHQDASRAYVDSDYSLIGVFEGNGRLLCKNPKKLSSFFVTTKGEELTLEMVEENASRSPSKARFKLLNWVDNYLFCLRESVR